MRLIADRSTRIVIYGITSRLGKIIAEDYERKGLNLIGGVVPGEGGSWGVDGRIPIFDSLHAAAGAVSPEGVIIAVPSLEAYQTILETINEGIKLIICVTHSIPIKDLARIRVIIQKQGITFLGPDTFGIYSPGNFSIGTFPLMDIKKGRVGLIARNGQVAFESAALLSENGYGISTTIGLGGGAEIGVALIDLLQLFDQDPETDQIVLIEDSYGGYDQETLAFLTGILSKPIIAYLPEIKNPASAANTYAGLRDKENFQQFLTKKDAIRAAGIPMADNLIALSNLLKRF